MARMGRDYTVANALPREDCCVDDGFDLGAKLVDHRVLAAVFDITNHAKEMLCDWRPRQMSEELLRGQGRIDEFRSWLSSEPPVPATIGVDTHNFIVSSRIRTMSEHLFVCHEP